MITIAICDDDSAVVGDIERLIRESQIFSENLSKWTNVRIRELRGRGWGLP